MSNREYESYWKRGKYKVLFIALGGFPVFLLSKLVPKNPKLWVYGSQNGYRIADNSYYHFIQDETAIKKVYVTKNSDELARSDLKKGTYCLSKSLRGLWYQLRAGRAFYSHSVFDLASPLICATHVTCFQHGYPIKLGGLADPNSTWLSNKLINWTVRNLVPYIYYYHADEVWTPGGPFEHNTKEVFALTSPSIVIAQSPRLSAVKKNTQKGKLLIALTHSSKLSLRDKLHRLGLLKSSDFSISKRIRGDATIIVRPHPLDYDLGLEKELIENAELDKTLSIYENLGSYESVITDFSSIGFDAMELGIEAHFWTEDLLDFLREEIGLFDSIVEFLENTGLQSVPELWDQVSGSG